MIQKITKLFVAAAFTLAITVGTVVFMEEVGEPASAASSGEAVAIQIGNGGGGC